MGGGGREEMCQILTRDGNGGGGRVRMSRNESATSVRRAHVVLYPPSCILTRGQPCSSSSFDSVASHALAALWGESIFFTPSWSDTW